MCECVCVCVCVCVPLLPLAPCSCPTDSSVSVRCNDRKQRDGQQSGTVGSAGVGVKHATTQRRVYTTCLRVLRIGCKQSVVFTLSDARSFFCADVKNSTIGFKVQF